MASESSLIQRWHPAYQSSASGKPLKRARHPAYQKGGFTLIKSDTQGALHANIHQYLLKVSITELRSQHYHVRSVLQLANFCLKTHKFQLYIETRGFSLFTVRCVTPFTCLECLILYNKMGACIALM